MKTDISKYPEEINAQLLNFTLPEQFEYFECPKGQVIFPIMDSNLISTENFGAFLVEKHPTNGITKKQTLMFIVDPENVETSIKTALNKFDEEKKVGI